MWQALSVLSIEMESTATKDNLKIDQRIIKIFKKTVCQRTVKHIIF